MIEFECGKAPFCKKCKRMSPEQLVKFLRLFYEEEDAQEQDQDREEEYTYLDGVDYFRNQPYPDKKNGYIDDEDLPF